MKRVACCSKILQLISLFSGLFFLCFFFLLFFLFSFATRFSSWRADLTSVGVVYICWAGNSNWTGSGPTPTHRHTQEDKGTHSTHTHTRTAPTLFAFIAHACATVRHSGLQPTETAVNYMGSIRTFTWWHCDTHTLTHAQRKAAYRFSNRTQSERQKLCYEFNCIFRILLNKNQNKCKRYIGICYVYGIYRYYISGDSLVSWESTVRAGI